MEEREKTLSFSPEAKAIWEALDKKQKKVICKNNLFRNERDAAIRAIIRRGVKLLVLAEITRMRRNGIICIAHRGEGIKLNVPKNINQKLKALKKAIDALYKTISWPRSRRTPKNYRIKK